MFSLKNIFQKTQDPAEEYCQKAQWGRSKPGTLAVALDKLLKNDGIRGGLILDAGAGFGIDSTYFARKGFSVKAVDKSPGAIPYILENIKKYRVENKVEVINKPIQEVVKNIPTASLVAVYDGGMSHSLDGQDKKTYAQEVLRTLQKGGFFSLSHFSENEDANPEMGRTRQYLEELFPPKNFAVVRDWEENCWTFEKTGDKHCAWRVILKKK